MNRSVLDKSTLRWRDEPGKNRSNSGRQQLRDHFVANVTKADGGDNPSKKRGSLF